MRELTACGVDQGRAAAKRGIQAISYGRFEWAAEAFDGIKFGTIGWQWQQS